MLLTGFDAPIEQVMYIDKRLKEHNLLQAIARVNRVAKGKQRGFIVDYIGLANHLTEALIDLRRRGCAGHSAGAEGILTEMPDTRRTLQTPAATFPVCWAIAKSRRSSRDNLPTPEAEVAVVHAAVGAMEEIKPRADFEVYLKKFLQSLNLILPHEAAANAYRGPARRFGYLLRMVKERYKDESIDICGRRRESAGADQRAPDRTWGSIRRFRRSNCCRRISWRHVRKHSRRRCRGKGERDGARHPQALYDPLR